MTESTAYRAKVVSDWRDENPFRYGAGVTVPIDEMDARKLLLEDPRRERVVAALGTKTDRLLAEWTEAKPKLSPAALATCGLKYRADPSPPSPSPQEPDRDYAK